MSDFDDVLERLLSDPSFRSALAANPDAALAGYRLDADERELLNAQVSSGAGGEHAVEARTTKSGLAGLLGPVTTALGVSAAGHSSPFAASGGSLGDAPGGQATFGGARADGPGGEAFGAAAGGSSMGSAPGHDQGGTGGSIGTAPAERAADYRTWVDADGDGSWDRHQAYERADGGVDIHIDLNRDGVADFIGHDYDRDGLVDDAEYDDNADGVMDRRMYDDNGDGWMDREKPIHPDR